jgi:SAM-dependent methyltransferase
VADPFDLDQAFDEDYLHFYAPYLTEEQDEADAALIAELLDLAPDERVLDLACGHGRIAVRLAAAGCRVTGLDRSPLFLARARALAAARNLELLWLEDDVRRLAFCEEFDAVVHWFTSFGYFEDAENRAILERIRRALVPGGRVLVETINVFQAALDSDGWQVRRAGAHDLLADHLVYDPVSGRQNCARSLHRAGRAPRELEFSVRLFTATELRTWLEDAGFADVRAYGGEGEEFRIDSERLILTARRPA